MKRVNHDIKIKIMVKNIWELGEFIKVQKFQSLARMLKISVNSDWFSCTMLSD